MITLSKDEAPAEVLCFRLVLLLSQQLRYLMDQRLASDGLTTQQAMLLNIVAYQPTAPSLTQVATDMATSYQNVKQLVIILERKGFLQLVADPTDGRVRRLQATGKSCRHWQRRNESDFAHIDALFAGLSEKERDSLLLLLGKLEDGIGRTYRAARG